MRTFQRRLLLGSVVILALSPALFAQPVPEVKAGKTQFFTGKVIPLAQLLDKIGSKLDPDAGPHWMALVTEEGKLYPLIKDAGSKMFFTDSKVRDKKVRITGRLLGDSHLLQVINIHSFKDGKLSDIYYWCEVCVIRRNAGGVCECCGGPMELREVPLK